MVAPSYAESRSALAKASGLGQSRKAAASAPEPIVEAATTVAEKPKRASRVKASAPTAVVAAPESIQAKRAPLAKAVGEPVVEPPARPKRARKTAATTGS